MGTLTSLAVVAPLFQAIASGFVVVNEFGEPDPSGGSGDVLFHLFTLAVLAGPCVGAIIMAAFLIRSTRSLI